MIAKIIIGVLLVLLGVFAVLAGVGFYLSPQDALKKTDAIVVISGGDTNKRTEEGIRLWREGWGKFLIFSGAAKEGISNAAVMKKIATTAGVPADKIFLEEKAQNTLENANFTAPILTQQGFKSIILVTSPYHQRRAYLAFRQVLGQDFIILNHSAIDTNWRKRNWWLSGDMFYLTLAELQKIVLTGLLASKR
jgi:uncharacterized SAM-binding protein YcdF (DUF218 family)